mmetsp:Transcript_19888/g.67376  ORF Transcript_19888/g.67376 Transcript_19888/m.67376 type:complete len:393 (-) Transcript_19888:272-1450(-)
MAAVTNRFPASKSRCRSAAPSCVRKSLRSSSPRRSGKSSPRASDVVTKRAAPPGGGGGGGSASPSVRRRAMRFSVSTRSSSSRSARNTSSAARTSSSFADRARLSAAASPWVSSMVRTMAMNISTTFSRCSGVKPAPAPAPPPASSLSVVAADAAPPRRGGARCTSAERMLRLPITRSPRGRAGAGSSAAPAPTARSPETRSCTFLVRSYRRNTSSVRGFLASMSVRSLLNSGLDTDSLATRMERILSLSSTERMWASSSSSPSAAGPPVAAVVAAAMAARAGAALPSSALARRRSVSMRSCTSLYSRYTSYAASTRGSGASMSLRSAAHSPSSRRPSCSSSAARSASSCCAVPASGPSDCTPRDTAASPSGAPSARARSVLTKVTTSLSVA